MWVVYIFVLLFQKMASRPVWTQEDLDKALLMIKEERMSFREAALAYGIPKSTLHDHFSGIEKGYKAWPSNTPFWSWRVHASWVGFGDAKDWLWAYTSPDTVDSKRFYMHCLSVYFKSLPFEIGSLVLLLYWESPPTKRVWLQRSWRTSTERARKLFTPLRCLRLLLRPFWDRSRAVVVTWLAEYCIQLLAVHVCIC